MDEKEALIQLVAFLANVVTKQSQCRYEAIALHAEGCKEHMMMRFPTIQTSLMQSRLAQIAEYPTDQEHLRAAMDCVLKAIAPNPQT
jgi:hypothetical protein